LLDKINEHERVVNYLVEMQLNNLERSKPRDVLRAVLDTETLQKCLNKKLIEQYPDGIKLASD
jgi:hypothetical protein